MPSLGGFFFIFGVAFSRDCAILYAMQEIIVEKVNQYGVEHIRVVDQKLRDVIGSLTGRKTLLKRDVAALKMLGFTVRVKGTESVEL